MSDDVSGVYWLADWLISVKRLSYFRAMVRLMPVV